MKFRPWQKSARRVRSRAALVTGLCLMTAIVHAAPSEEPAWRQTVRAFAASHFKNPAWGLSHSERDYELAIQLAASDHVALDDDVLFAAAYLHDMAAFKPWEVEGKDHSDVGAVSIDTVLKGTSFPVDRLEAVRGAIRTHMYYRAPVGPEATYLHDADALDWLGAIGIARVLALADTHGQSPTVPDEVALVEKNMKVVPPHIVSSAGRSQIAARIAEGAEFLKELRSESDDLRSL
ncbi:HD domain-containing protein [Dyella sp. GSA-30]|uniref:HD domain-containing protein n=1 Tax=Dyella sp. GSA-30 TaxID=2994496 RepID=UPI00249060B5|nr:HD domain-containing protein [Dyella sp. GSA-30]BDU21570.1 phosphohydrolase [Dyella sp. GSA-30]